MRRLLVLGAGRSASSLITYLLQNAGSLNCEIRVGDISLELAQEKVVDYPAGSAFAFNIDNENQREQEISQAHLVVSLLPAKFHPKAARACLKFGKNLLTASYISPEMAALHKPAVDQGVLLLNECGLDPGLDHMTAMAALNKVRNIEGAVINSFISYTGGLVAPESDDNPWHYKFTWNPRNVVLAGKETARFIRNGRYKYIPYHRLFTRLDTIEIKGYGTFEGYPNRDSLKYRSLYGLQGIETMLRGTMRRPGFCEAWNVFVQLGMTDDSYLLEDLPEMTYRDFVNTFLYFHPHKSVEEKLCDYLSLEPRGSTMEKLSWLGLFDKTPIGLMEASPAGVLQHLLESKWTLKPEDKDMIVMQHKLGYSVNGASRMLSLSLVTKGDIQNTAMSKTVGWPLAIAAKLVLSGAIEDRGVQLPVAAHYYEPILKEMKQLGVDFIEEETVPELG